MFDKTAEELCEIYDNIDIQHAIEICEYIKIFEENFFEKHYDVNQYITKNNKWDYFTHIRSYNDHGNHTDIPGIIPDYFKIVCRELGIKDFHGKPLDKYTLY